MSHTFVIVIRPRAHGYQLEGGERKGLPVNMPEVEPHLPTYLSGNAKRWQREQ